MRLQTMKMAAAIALAASVAVGGAAVVVAQPEAQTKTSSSAQAVAPAAAPLLATVADDVTVELVGISSISDPATWWKPDGSPLADPPMPSMNPFGARQPPPAPGDSERFNVAFVVTHTRPTDELGMKLDAVPYSTLNAFTEGTMTTGFPWSNAPAPTTRPAEGPIKTLYVVQLRAMEYATNVDLRFTVAGRNEPWDTLETVGVDGNVIGEMWTQRQWTLDQTRDGGTDREGAYISWSTPSEQQGMATVEVFDDFGTRERQVIAIDHAGKAHEAAPPEMKRTVTTLPATTATVTQTMRARQEYRMVGDVRHYTTRAQFPGLRLADVDHFELRMRPRPAVQFSEVALAPGAAVRARVGPADPPRVVRGVGYVSTPADTAIHRVLEFNGERLDEAVERISKATGVKIYVHWEWIVQLQRGGPEHSVPHVVLTNPTAELALRAVFAAASFNDIGVVVSDDGRTIRVLSGNRMLRSDGRVWLPGKSR